MSMKEFKKDSDIEQPSKINYCCKTKHCGLISIILVTLVQAIIFGATLHKHTEIQPPVLVCSLVLNILLALIITGNKNLRDNGTKYN